MFKALCCLILAGTVASPAAAALYRVDVTGSADVTYNYGWSLDRSDDENWVYLGSGSISGQDIPPNTPGAGFLELVHETAGSLFYSAQSGHFFDCTGLLTPICHFNGLNQDGLGKVPVVDALLNVFDLDLYYYCCASLRGWTYQDDAVDVFTVGPITYGMADREIEWAISSLSVTAVPVPASVPLLVAGLGALGLVGRRRRRSDQRRA